MPSTAMSPFHSETVLCEDGYILIKHSANKCVPGGRRDVFLDIKRAFDTASHVHLLCGLLELAVSARTLRRIADFLKGRVVFIETSQGKSSHHCLNQGVPQGSVLSPFLFNCVMAELPHRFPPAIHCSLYADDVSISASGSCASHIKAILQGGLDIVDKSVKEEMKTKCSLCRTLVTTDPLVS